MEPLLKAQGLTKSFGALKALGGLDLELFPGEVLGVIGPNGSGKTTMFNLMAGVLKPDAGRVWLEGREITGWPEHRICRLGLVKTDQVARPFAEMSVLDNVMVGSLFGAGRRRNAAREQARELLEFVGLQAVAGQPAGALTVAMRRRLDLARTLATNPRVMLLDENLAGLNPGEIDQCLELLRAVNQRGVSLVLVEHVMRAVLGISQRLVVLDFGIKIAEGPPQEVMHRREVVEAYLGERYA